MGRNLLVPRKNVKPFLYPEASAWKDAIRHAYWIHTEFNYDPDVQDYKVGVTDAERTAFTRVILGTAQIEVKVKDFWTKIGELFGHYEISQVGITFGESEERHFDAYSHILEILGLNELFEQIDDIPVLRDRYNYLGKVMSKDVNTPDEIAAKILLFAELIEFIGLFGFFYVIMSFNKGKKKRFKGISNAVEATSKEEQIHGEFGIYLYNLLKEENPYIGESVHIQESILNIIQKGYVAEMKILDWVFEEGDIEDCTLAEVKNFVTGRFNQAMTHLGVDYRFETDPELDKKNMWFYEELKAPKEKDFFDKRGTDYSKGQKSYDDLF